MENAQRIKEWCSKELSPMAWPLIAMRALPEIMASGKHTSLIDINENTVFESEVIEILDNCIQEAYQVRIPEEVLNGELDLSAEDNWEKEILKEMESAESAPKESPEGFEFVDKQTGAITMQSLLEKSKNWFKKLFKN